MSGALVLGACLGARVPLAPDAFWVALSFAAAGAGFAHCGARLLRLACVAAVACSAGALMADRERTLALDAPLRASLDAAFGGFRLGTLGPEGEHPPAAVRLRLSEDGARTETGAVLRGGVLAVRLQGTWVRAPGGVTVSVSGAVPTDALVAWRAGRTLEAPMTFRRPARYLDPGVPDAERELALAGTALFASVKSARLVELVARGRWHEECAADVRAWVRTALTQYVTPHASQSAAIVAAVLIGDRAGLSAELRDRLQAAGVYHVLAISGGNIAIIVGLVLVVARITGAAARVVMPLAIAGLLAYAQVVVAGPSVFRAVTMAVTYLAARALDHRSARWHALAVAAALSVCHDPLDVVDAGFALTFLATGALLAVGAHLERLRGLAAPVQWLLASIAASVATELALLPVAAVVFGRVTLAGVLLNLVAIPVMGVVQCAGLVVCLGLGDGLGRAAGWLAHAGASALVASAALVDVWPWLVVAVPPPSALAVVVYVAAGAGVLLLSFMWRVASGLLLAGACLVLVGGSPFPAHANPLGRLRVVMFDVGQGESIALFWPDGTTTLVDAGGVPFGAGGFDVGARVLRPALLASGVRRLDDLVITHGDPDHIGGAMAIARTFRPRRLIEGIDVPGHEPSAALRETVARGLGARQAVLDGDQWTRGGATIRVLNPPAPDWERRRVRNDDSLVLDVRFGDVGLLLTGDISEEVERAIIPRLVHAPIRILKVAHHGSRTSTSDALLQAWRPQYGVVSAGRGNRFGHPTPEVVTRLEQVGARLFRTDRQGALTIDTDGRTVAIRTFVP